MKILAYRFSAFGDVVMAATVLREVAEQNPNVSFLFMSRKQFRVFFDNHSNIEFLGIDLDEYKGIFGMYRLFKKITQTHSIDAVADLHDVIRTKFLSKLFRWRGRKVSIIDKGKEEKEHLTDVKNIYKTQLKSTVERYADVFLRLGIPVKLSHELPSTDSIKSGIGFAPFAQHKGKMLPLDKSEELLRILSQKEQIYLFGGGDAEKKVLENWEKKYPNVLSVAGKKTLREELELIKSLRLMISMDSANMHLASFVGTRCVSVWCATHPYAGFLGYGQSAKDAVGQKDLTCRPCSVFGNKECFRGDYACQNELQVSEIIQTIYR